MLVSDDFWRDRRVFLTGHTGFKGSWLALWLTRLGANVTGFALPADQVSLFRQASVSEQLTHHEGDICDPDALRDAMVAADPEVVFHLAAQPLVRLSYEDPVRTFATNVQGTVNVLDACRRIASVRAIVCITSDKCYENKEWVWPYRETDPMGGFDPYSSSKGAAELVIASYRRSFFDEKVGVASVRAGNVIGGGDWAPDRLVPDIVRALIRGERPQIRAPHAIRPWQHVLEALSGYIAIAERLARGDVGFAEAWNFGPADEDTRPVGWIADRMFSAWGQPHGMAGSGWDRAEGPRVHEANLLKLDCTKARAALGWRPALGLERALDWIVTWHRHVAEFGSARDITFQQLDAYRELIRTPLLESIAV